eukprot:COSAG04_NODE_1351_length_7119_cov_17.943447_3_plen_89_part_00
MQRGDLAWAKLYEKGWRTAIVYAQRCVLSILFLCMTYTAWCLRRYESTNVANVDRVEAALFAPTLGEPLFLSVPGMLSHEQCAQAQAV